MPCGCKGSKYVPPEQVAARSSARRRSERVRVQTDPNDPANFWNGPKPKTQPEPQQGE